MNTVTVKGMSKRGFVFALAGLAVAALLGYGGWRMWGGPSAEDAVVNIPPAARRLTKLQYTNVVSDIFGPDVRPGGRMEPDLRQEHLIAIGASKTSITASGLEQYDAAARGIAQQVLGQEDYRAQVMPCEPKSETAADPDCASTFLSRAGTLLYRRPLTSQELEQFTQIASKAATETGDFYGGLQLALSTLMISGPFLFIVDNVDQQSDGEPRLDSYSIASRLSFFLWNSVPDAELLRAAEAGELHTQKGVEGQVDRMLESPKLRQGMRAFFSDMLELDLFDTLTKDAAIYPAFSFDVARDAREQTLRTLVNLLIDRDGDYRDIFTAKETFLNRVLASAYGIPVPTDALLDGNGWFRYEFPSDSEHSGILTQIGFVSAHSHPGRTSPTLRGKAVRELLMCQSVPDPPAGVDFTLIQDTKNPEFKTARDRLDAHNSVPSCAGCHKIMDPMGLALEAFDGVARHRTTENGAVIDTSGELDGVAFKNAAELGQAMRQNAAAATCLVNRLYSYSLGRTPGPQERPFLTDAKQRFVEDGYRLRGLLRAIATSKAFLSVKPAPNSDTIVANADIH